jgi:AcrR family transcriptional regulator
MQTKERILIAAIGLFNQQGTGAVSTNHIAEAAGISPGNLYYHYHNKDEIIRAIFERLFHEWDVGFNLPADRLPTIEDVQNIVRANFNIMLGYRFIYRELVGLLWQDSELSERFIAVRARGFDGFQGLFDLLVSIGVFTPPETPETVTRLADLVWLISEFWLATLEVSGQPVDDTQMQRGIDLMMQVLQPYISPSSSQPS